MRDVLRAAAFLGRSVVADVLTRVACRVRPFEESEIVSDADRIVMGARAGDVTLSEVARRMREEVAALPTFESEDDHAPPPPLRGSLEWRQRNGDRR